MPNNIDIKIILPPNLKSLYLSDPEVLKADQNTDYGLSDKGIINTTDNFFVGRVSLDPATTKNKSRLVFGIRLKRRDILTDNNTEQYVDLKTIRSLTLSNSPDFSGDSNSTIEIKNWPFDITDADPTHKVTGSFKNYVYNLNPLSFYDSSIKFDSGAGYGRSVENNGDDLFIINNWPLSGNGGISTIFIKIVARSIIDTTDIVYPGNATIFDQISWQSDPGIRPGLPVPVLTYATENHILPPAKIYTGNKTLFRFSSANEQSTSIPGQINKDGLSDDSDIFGSGIARYIGDIYEVRGLSTSFTDYGMFTWLSSTSNIYRTIAPEIPHTSTSVVKYNFDGNSYSNPSTVQSNTSVTGTLSTSFRGVNFLLNTSFTNEFAYKPDIYAQANFKVEVDPRKPFDYKLVFKFNKSGLSAPQSASNQEIGVELQLTNFLNTAKTLVINNPSTSSIIQTTTIADLVSKELLEGGQLEIYLSNLKVNNADDKALFKAYFTPNNRKEHSYLLANSTISNFSTLGWQTTSVSANLTIVQNINNLSYTLNEFVSGAGRLLLDVDLGDCKYDDNQLDLNKVIYATNWYESLSKSWNLVRQNHSPARVSTFEPISPTNFLITAQKPFKLASGQNHRICVSIIDEDSSYDTNLREQHWNDWLSKNPPPNFFVLFRPSPGGVNFPTGFLNHPQVKFYEVTREDSSPPGQPTDYYELIKDIITEDTGIIQVAVDNSGSMVRSDVERDLNSFKNKIESLNINYLEQSMGGGEQWIYWHLDPAVFPPALEEMPGRSYSEIQALSPIFSDRAKINFSVSHLSGDFYVALYQKPITVVNTSIASYLDEYNTLSSNTIDQPALMLKFSESDIKLFQKVTPTNELVVSDVAPYNLKANTFAQKDLVIGLAKTIGVATGFDFSYDNQYDNILGVGVGSYIIKITFENYLYIDSNDPDILLAGVKLNTLPVQTLTYGALNQKYRNQMSASAITAFNNTYKIYSSGATEKFTLLGLAVTVNKSGVELYFSSDIGQSTNVKYSPYIIQYITAQEEAKLIQDYTIDVYRNVIPGSGLLKNLTFDFVKYTNTFSFVQKSTSVTPTYITQIPFDYYYNPNTLNDDPNALNLLYKQDAPNEFLGIYSSLGTDFLYLKFGSELTYKYIANQSSGKVYVRNLVSAFENYEIIVSNGPLTDENLNISILRNQSQIANFSTALRLPGPSNGLGWNFALGVRSIFSNQKDNESSSPSPTIYNPLLITCKYASINHISGYVTSNNTQGQILNAPDTIDGNILSVGNLILVKNQLDENQNGIYKVSSENLSGNSQLKTASDFSVLNRGGIISIQQGTYTGKTFFLYAEGNQTTFGDVDITWVDKTNVQNFQDVKVASLTNFPVTTIAGVGTGLSTPATIDNYTLQVNDRVLIKEQIDTKLNGIYKVEYINPPDATKLNLISQWRTRNGTSFSNINYGEYTITNFSAVAVRSGVNNSKSLWASYKLAGTTSVHFWNLTSDYSVINVVAAGRNFAPQLDNFNKYYIDIPVGNTTVKRYLNINDRFLSLNNTGSVRNPFYIWNGFSFVDEQDTDIKPTVVVEGITLRKFIVGKSLNGNRVASWRNNINFPLEDYIIYSLDDELDKNSFSSYEEVSVYNWTDFAIFTTPKLVNVSTTLTDLFVTAEQLNLRLSSGTEVPINSFGANPSSFAGSTVLIRNQSIIENGIYKLGNYTSGLKITLTNVEQPTNQSSVINTRINQTILYSSQSNFSRQNAYITYGWPRPNTNAQPTRDVADVYVTPFEPNYKNNSFPSYHTMALPVDANPSRIWYKEDILYITATSSVVLYNDLQYAVKGAQGDGIYTLKIQNINNVQGFTLQPFNLGQPLKSILFGTVNRTNMWEGGNQAQWAVVNTYFGYMTSTAANQTWGPGKLFFEKRLQWNAEIDNRAQSSNELNNSSQFIVITNNINLSTVSAQTVFNNNLGTQINLASLPYQFGGLALTNQSNSDENGFYVYSNLQYFFKLEAEPVWNANKSPLSKCNEPNNVGYLDPSGTEFLYVKTPSGYYDWTSTSAGSINLYTYKVDHFSNSNNININGTSALIDGIDMQNDDIVFLRAQTNNSENNKFYRVSESASPLLLRASDFPLGTTMQPSVVKSTNGVTNSNKFWELYFKPGFVVGNDSNIWIATSSRHVYTAAKIGVPNDIGDVNSYSVPPTLDGVSLSNNDRILLLNQNNLKSNGIYQKKDFRTVNLTPSLIVAPETKVRFDTRAFVTNGQRNSNTYWGIAFETLTGFNYGTDDIFWIKQPKSDLSLAQCTVATVANVNLNQAPNLIDGVSLEVGFRILVKDQTNKSLNGIYRVVTVGTGSNGTWERTSDLNTNASLIPHLTVNILRGTTNANKNYILYLGNPSNGTYTINSTSQDWIYIFTSSSITASTSFTPTYESRIILGPISVAGLPPRELLGQTDLNNQRHFMKAIGYSAYHKPFLGQALIAGNTDFWNFDYSTKSVNLNHIYFAQQFTVRSRSLETSCFPQLLELKFEDNRYINNPNDNLPNPSVNFYHFTNPVDPYASTEDPDKLSYIGTSLLNFWIEGNISETVKTGLNSPNNTLVQFDLKTYLKNKNSTLELVNGQRYWLVIKVPKGMNLGRARGFEVASRILKKDYQGTTFIEGVGSGNNEGWQIVPYTWFKLFQGYRERYDNVYPQAGLQMRVGGESHALISTEYSGLSRMLEVDVDAPNSPADFSILNFTNAADDTNRPVITEILQPSVRTALIKIKANDSQSGNWVFRIGKETDFGNIEYTDWLDWDTYRRRNSQNQPIQNEISYSIFLYGSTWLKPDGSGLDPYTNSSTYTAQNMGTDGPRKIWVDVMDKVGNKSQSYPVTLNGQLIALVDTVPPDADISLIAPDNVVVDYTNTDEIIVKVISNDTISSVKDMRFRIIDGAGTVAGWSEWYHYSEITRRKIESNIIALATPSPVVEDTKPGGTPIIGGIGTTNIGGIGTSNTGTATSPSVSTSTEQITWFIPPQSPISGLKRIEVQVRDYGNNSLQPMSMWSTLYKDSYLSRNSFVTLGSNPMAFANGVLQFPRNVFVNCSVVWQSSFESSACVYFGAVKYDNFYKNQSQDEITFSNIVWNVENEKAYELISTATGYYKRKIILNDSIDTITLSINGVSVPKFISVAQTPGTSYRVDSSFGYLIIKNIENIPSFNTPVFTCAINRSEAQIYKWDYNSIQRIANFGYAGERIILCMLALNKEIIFGTGTGNLWAFDGINFRGPLFTATDLDGNKLPITCVTLHEFMHEANPFIYIGTGKKSFIFRSLYSDTNQVISNTASWERCKGESFYNKDYTLTSFTSAYNALFITSRNGKVFKYVRKLIRTNSTNEGQISIELNLKRSEADPFESKVLPIRNSVAFANQIIVSISDRPEIHSYTEKLKQIPTIGSDRVTNIFEHRLSSIKAASTASLAWEYTGTDLVGTVDQNLTLDTITILNNDRVLIKNQADPIQNGIYIFRKSTGAQSRLTRAMDMEFNSKLKINTHVICLSGATNGNKIFYLQNVLHKEYADIVIGTDSVNFSIVKTDTKYFFTRWTSYDFNKTFVQSPMSKGAFQFYLNNGESDSRNNTKYVYNKSIEDKNYENQYKEVTVLKGNLNESVLFETKTGSDWSYASGLPGPYTVDFEVRHVSGTGEQGFEVVGNNALVSVKFSNTGVTIQSGINKISKSFSKRSDAFTPYSIIPESYPQYGLVSIWNYSQGEDEDSNNFNPNVVSYGSLDNWRAVKFCTIRRSTEAYTQQNDNYLIVEPILTYFEKGDPIIGVESASNNNQPFFIADTHTYITVRLRFSISASSSSVRYVTRGNISTKSGLSVENYVLKAGDSILLRKQTNSEENGVYFVQNDNAASWTKLTTAIAALDIRDGVTYYKHTVDYTNANSASYWHTSIDIPNLNIKTFWDVTSFLPEESFRENQFVSTPISFSTDYLTYEIRPAWLGPVSSLYFEFENIKNITSGIIPKIHIDYVSVQTESGYYTITKEFTPIRLTMCGSTRRDVKLWVGKFEEPFIEVDNFVDISNVTLNPYIKFGKLIPEAGASEWAWANLKFHVGHVIPPVISDVQEFHPSFRFPSTGGAGEIVKHAGTIWCITDGIYIRKSTDNPNDHTFKTWKYIPEEELWRYQSPTAPLIRVAGKQARGNIKVFTAISYRNGLVAAGQVAEVGNPNPRPEES